MPTGVLLGGSVNDGIDALRGALARPPRVEGGVPAVLGRRKRPSDSRALLQGAAVAGEARETWIAFSGKQLLACPAVNHSHLPWALGAGTQIPGGRGGAQPRGHGEGCRFTRVHRSCWHCKISDLRELEWGQD